MSKKRTQGQKNKGEKMSAAKKLNLGDFDNPDQIKKFIDEDIHQVGSMLHAFFESRGNDFRELDQFLNKNHKKIKSYCQFLEKAYRLERPNEENIDSFDPRSFIRCQKSHIDELQKIGCPQSLRIIEFKKSFTL